MTAYHVFLYIHLLALVAAAATSSVVHLAHARARRVGSIPEMRQWLLLGASTARVFPIATLTLLASGALMVASHGPWSWTAGWVDAGCAAVAFLLLSGPVLATRGKRTGRSLATLSPGDVEWARTLLHDPVAGALSWANTGLALGTIYAMAAKPGLAGSLAALLVGAAAGVACEILSERRAAVPATAAPERLAA
jgi:hypothetical protein